VAETDKQKTTIKGDTPDTDARPVVAPAKDIAMLPGTVPIPTADGRIDYVAGGDRAVVYPNTYHALSQRIDDATLEFGYPLYDQMLKDAIVNGSYSILKQGVLSQPVLLRPAVEPEPGTDPLEDSDEDSDDPPAEDIELAEEIADFCTYVLNRLDRPIEDTLYEMLDALAYGSKAAEQIYEIAQYGPWKGKMILKNLKCKPRWAWAWVVDPMSNVLGILGAVPGALSIPLGIIGAQGEVSGMGVFLPRNKFAILQNMPTDGDPRGRSHLRCVVGPWNQKVRTYPQYSNYLDRFAVGHLFATVPENAAPQYPVDAAGKQTGEDPIPATQFLYQQMLNFKNGSVMVGPSGTTLQAIDPPSDGAAFGQAFNFLDRQIVFGILNTVRGVLEAEHGSKADSEVGQDDKERVIRYYRGCVGRMLYRDVVKRLVQYNYGDDVADRLTPRVLIGETEIHDFSKDASAVASLKSSGYLHDSQLPATDARLGLKIREISPEEIAAKKAALVALANPQPAAPAGGPKAEPDPGDAGPKPAPAPTPAAKPAPAPAKPKPAPKPQPSGGQSFDPDPDPPTFLNGRRSMQAVA